MSMPKDMEKYLISVVSRLILEKEENAPFRLSEDENALKYLKCTNPILGKWIDDCDFPFLIETLMLDDATFAKEFPDVRLTADERKELTKVLEGHCELCPHCSQKRISDLEWQSRVNQAFAENREVIGEALSLATGKKGRD